MANKRYIPKFQKGGYFGDIAMQGEKGLDVRKLIEGAQAKQKAYQKGMSKRKFWGGVSDFFETGLKFIPGVGKYLSAGLDVLSEQIIQHNIDVEGGPDLSELETMWTAGQGTAGQEEWEKMYGASDVSLGESLMRGATDFMGSAVGGKFMEGVGSKIGDWGSNLFSGGGDEYISDPGTWFTAREGGRVPKFKGGGRTPTKEDISVLSELLELYSKGDPTVKSGKPMFTKEGGYSKDYFAERFNVDPEQMLIDTLSYRNPSNLEFDIRGDGDRVSNIKYTGNIMPRKAEYMGEKRKMIDTLKEEIGTSNYMDIMGELMGDEYGKLQKMIENKYFDMDQFEKMRYEMKDFKDGGRVPKKYYGGGSVQGGTSPSIVDYFSRQGKTLGGSDNQSLAEKLGGI